MQKSSEDMGALVKRLIQEELQLSNLTIPSLRGIAQKIVRMACAGDSIAIQTLVTILLDRSVSEEKMNN